MPDKKIGYNDLDTSLKWLVVLGWIYTCAVFITFFIGFIQGLMVYD